MIFSCKKVRQIIRKDFALMLGNRKILKAALQVIAVYAVMTAAAINSLPEDFRLLENSRRKFSWNVPLVAEFYDESITVMRGGQKLSGNITIDLRDEFVVSTSDEAETDIKLTLFGLIPVKTVSLSVIPEKEIIPLGKTVGVCMTTDGILVLGTGRIDGKASPSDGILKSVYFILKANDETLENKDDLINVLAGCGGSVDLLIYRDGGERNVRIKPIESEEGYRIGAWVRDSTQGIGTLTYFDPQDSSFGALGQGVYDVDIMRLMPLREGEIVGLMITGVRKGKAGNPGEIMGILEKDNVLGKIYKNTECGLYGVMEKPPDGELIPIGLKQDAKEGGAFIMTDVVTGENELYSVEIRHVNRYGVSPDKGLVIEVTDERLVEKTGGIVQGMSGSPIIQNGKIIGAVTHVFVRNPKKGYGIFIESMLEEGKK